MTIQAAARNIQNGAAKVSDINTVNRLNTAIHRLKNEQNNLRKIILRIDTIRNTDFISSAYAIVESMAFIISIGLVFINIEAEKQNLFAEVFFTLLVSFLIFYMIALIKDIDDPFDYQNNGESGSEINLDVFNDHLKSLK